MCSLSLSVECQKGEITGHQKERASVLSFFLGCRRHRRRLFFNLNDVARGDGRASAPRPARLLFGLGPAWRALRRLGPLESARRAV